jgi:hypothetical protein|tara:strand:- start:79 stop:357 length:279 start_codon:yes stop_codon:yes gene_type:complete
MKLLIENWQKFLKEEETFHIDTGFDPHDIPNDEESLQMDIDDQLNRLLPAYREKIKKALGAGASISALRQQLGQNQAVDMILVQIGKITGEL